MDTTIGLLREILTSPAGSFSFILGLMMVAGWLIYYVTKKVTTIENSHNNLTSGIGKLDTHIDEIRRDISYLKGTIEIIRSGSTPLAKSHSPVSLTEKGLEVAQEIKADDIIARNWDRIMDDIEQQTLDKNPYDIQQYCIEISSVEPERFFSIEDLNIIKKYAYNQGQVIQYYAPVFGVKIRDKYFEIKKINPSDVDLHDPQK